MPAAADDVYLHFLSFAAVCLVCACPAPFFLLAADPDPLVATCSVPSWGLNHSKPRRVFSVFAFLRTALATPKGQRPTPSRVRSLSAVLPPSHTMDTLSQLKGVSIVVADTADFTQIAQYQPRDATTNPAIIEAATRNPQFEGLVRDALQYACARGGTLEEQLDAAMTKLPVNFGCELLKRVPGRISTEVDARLSFDLAGSLAKGREIAAMYRAAGIGPERVLIKLAATWEGIQAAKQLEAEGIHCNCTLLFGFAQAVACAQVCPG